MNSDYRDIEIRLAVDKFYDEMEQLHVKRMELARCELEAWKELRNTLLGNTPHRLSGGYFIGNP